MSGFASPSFFGRLMKYPVAPGFDPRENRLTETLASVIREVDQAADVVARVLNPEIGVGGIPRKGPRARVDTQVATAGGRFVDLELLLPPGPEEPGHLLWIEIKVDAPVHGSQLEAYLTEIDKRAAEIPGEVDRTVVLLAPRQWWNDHADVPAAVIPAEWQRIGRSLMAMEASSASPEGWLVSEFVRYLEEEQLSDPKALTEQSALTLMQSDEAEEAAEALCEYADGYVGKHWGARRAQLQSRGTSPTPFFGVGYWAHFDGSPSALDRLTDDPPLWLEGGMRHTGDMDGLEEREGSVAFMAGLATDSRGHLARDERWFGMMVNREFVPLRLAGCHWLARLRYPTELLKAGDDLEAQGEALGKWIVSCFQELTGACPEA